MKRCTLTSIKDMMVALNTCSTHMPILSPSLSYFIDIVYHRCILTVYIGLPDANFLDHSKHGGSATPRKYVTRMSKQSR